MTVYRLLHCDWSSGKVKGVTSTPMTSVSLGTEVNPGNPRVAEAHQKKVRTGNETRPERVA